MFGIGMSVSSVGVLLGGLSESLSVDYLRSRFVGAMIGPLIVPLLARYSMVATRACAVGGFALCTGASIWALQYADASLAHLVVSFLWGLTTSATLTAIPLAVASLQGRIGIKAVFAQQASFGAGAALAPFLSSWVGLPYLLSIVCLCALSALKVSVVAIREDGDPSGQWHPKAIALLLVSVVLYAGVENGIANWLFAWTVVHASGQLVASETLLSLFWLGVVISRLAWPILAGRGAQPKVLLLGSMGFLTVLLLSLPVVGPGLPIATLGVGISVGPIFPLLIGAIGRNMGSKSFIFSTIPLFSAAGSLGLAASLGHVVRDGSWIWPACIAITAVCAMTACLAGLSKIGQSLKR